MTGLQIALRLHVVVYLVQIVFQLLAIQNVLFLKARDQSGFFDMLHMIAQFAALEDLAAFKLNLSHAHARAFRYLEGNGH